MNHRKIVAALAAASLAAGSGGAFAQAERNQQLLDQAERDAQRGYPRGDPRSGDARTPAIVDQRGNLHEVRPTPGGGAVVGPALPRRDDRPVERGYSRGDDRGYSRGDDRGYYRGDQRDYRGDRGYYRGDDRGYYRPDEWRHEGRGAGPYHNWYRGSRLPPEYRSRHYVVDDWRAHHLYAPPRGYQWVQSGGDYLLVAAATGIIAAILLNQ